MGPLAVRMPDGGWAVESLTGAGRSYVVDSARGTCTCPHYQQRLAGTNQVCKHVEVVRQQIRFASAVRKAMTVSDEDLTTLLGKYLERHDAVIAAAISTELAARSAGRQSDQAMRRVFA